MALALTIAYILLTFFSVGENFPDLVPYRIQLILGIISVVVTLLGIFIRGEFQFQKQIMLMAGFTGVIVLSWLPHGRLGGPLTAFQSFMPSGIVFFLTAFNMRSIRDLKILRFCILGLALYLAGRGLFEYFSDPYNSPFVISQAEFDVVNLRLQAQGVLGDPNEYAQFLLALLPLLCVGMESRGKIFRIGVILPIATLLLVAIFFTHSRGALVGLALVTGVFVMQRLKLVGGTLVTALGVALLAGVGFTGSFTGNRAISVEGGLDRLNIWSDGLGMFRSSPIWGVGFNGFTDTHVAGASIQTAHNSFLLCVAELGLIGCFFWVGLLLVSLWQLRLIANAADYGDSDPESRAWANGVLFALVAFLVPGFFLSETYAPMLYLLLGMSAAIARLEVERTGVELLPAGNRWALKTAMACMASMTLVYAMVRMRGF
jgi:putative inorganic carbon (hco3(-)) transporter